MTPDEIQKDREAGTPTRDEIANGMNCQTSGWAFDCYPIRFLPYKPDGRRQMGKRGRWQRMNEYGGWENCADPTQILADCVDPVTLTAENAALKERVVELEDALEPFARRADTYDPPEDDDWVVDWYDSVDRPTLGNFRLARAALEKSHDRP